MSSKPGEQLARFIGDMVNRIEAGKRGEVEAMNIEAVARHYGIEPRLVAAYRDLQLGRTG